MNILKRNNITFAGRTSGPTMLFAHGFGCNQNMWRLLIPHFEPTHQLALFDHVGSGKSDLSAYSKPKYSSLQGYADDIIEICDHLKLTKVIFVGHSVSSMIGILAANARPDLFSKLILVGPSPRYINDGLYFGGFEKHDIDGLLNSLDSNYLGWSSSMAPVIMANSEEPQLSDELAESFCATNPAIASHFAHVTFYSDNRHDLEKVSIDTLVLQCSEDIIAPQFVGEYVARKIKTSTLKILSATGHCPHLSAPAETAEAIKDFIGA